MKHYATGFDLEPGGGLDCSPGESSSFPLLSFPSFSIVLRERKRRRSNVRRAFSIARNGSMIYNVIGSLTSDKRLIKREA